MKKILTYISAALGLCLGAASCTPDNPVEQEKPRPQVENLTCTPDDEEVTLSWTAPAEGEPTDYLITYNDAAAAQQQINTEGATTYTIDGLTNDFTYTFSVQAVYGEALSEAVTAEGKPTSARVAVSVFDYTADATAIQLTWEKPSGAVKDYTLKYYPEGNEAAAKTETLGADVTTFTIGEYSNENNYIASLVANYPKGAAEAIVLKAHVRKAYIAGTVKAAYGQTMSLSFDKTAHPEATDIKWEFPGGTVINGETAEWTVITTVTNTVTLSAKIADKEITWPAIELEYLPMIVGLEATEFEKTDPYNGFKGSYPVFSPDGKTVYDVTFNKISVLYAYDVATGAEKWHYRPEKDGASYNPATVNPVTGDIYYGTNAAKQFYCVTPDGTLRWSYTGANKMKTTAPAVSADGKVVYIADTNGKLAALDAEKGTENWTVALGTPVFAMLINGEELVLGCKDKKVRFLSTKDGSETAAAIDVTLQPADVSGFAVADDKKTAYLPLNGGGLACIDIAAKTLIKENQFAGNNVWVPVVASNGYVVAGSKDSKIYGLTADLSEVKWTYSWLDEGVNNAFNYCHLCADTMGRVFVTSGQVQAKIHIINATDGTLLYGETYGNNASQKQMGGNNFLNGYLYSAFVGGAVDGVNYDGAFVSHYVGGERKFWGGPGGDICGSSNLQSPLLK